LGRSSTGKRIRFRKKKGGRIIVHDDGVAFEPDTKERRKMQISRERERQKEEHFRSVTASEERLKEKQLDDRLKKAKHLTEEEREKQEEKEREWLKQQHALEQEHLRLQQERRIQEDQEHEQKRLREEQAEAEEELRYEQEANMFKQEERQIHRFKQQQKEQALTDIIHNWDKRKRGDLMDTLGITGYDNVDKSVNDVRIINVLKQLKFNFNIVSEEYLKQFIAALKQQQREQQQQPKPKSKAKGRR
jgi:hypothetical protein